jgi:hypothetical protein
VIGRHLERRGRDRTVGIFSGTAHFQAAPPDPWVLPYDLVADTVAKSAAVVADEVVDWLARYPPPPGIRSIAPALGADA